MEVKIPLNGVTATPSDYACQDGDLSMVLGGVHDIGGITTIGTPKEVMSLKYDGENIKPILVHKVQGKEYIVGTINNGKGVVCINPEDLGEQHPFAMEGVVQNIVAFGNILSVYYDDRGPSYLRYNGNGYVNFGPMPELPQLEFGLELDKYESSEFEYTFRASIKDNIDDQSVFDSIDGFNAEYINALLGAANSAIQKNKDKFCYPFYVRYAFRLHDGTLTKHSAPVLMIPTEDLNPIFYFDKQPDRENGDVNEDKNPMWVNVKYKLKTDLIYASLRYWQTTAFTHEMKELWDGIIQSVEIFVSPQLYHYDMSPDSKKFEPSTLPESPPKCYGSPGATFGGKYPKGFYSYDRYNKINRESYLCPPLKESYLEDLKECFQFYHYATIEIKDLKEEIIELGDSPSVDINAFWPIESEVENLQDLPTRELMTDDYRTHWTYTSKHQTNINGRIHLSNVSWFVKDGMTLPAHLQYTCRYDLVQDGSDGGGIQRIIKNDALFRVYIKHQGEELVIETDNQQMPHDIGKMLKYLYISNPEAYRVEIVFNESADMITLPLETHPFLYGAFYFNDFEGIGIDTSKFPATNNQWIKEPNTILVSEPYNPFYSNPKNVATVGKTEVLCVASPSVPVSEGQFGQFPLYALTDDGVWALSTTSEGSYSAAQPVSRDICLNPRNVEMVDNDIAIMTEQGLKLLGGTNKVITTALNDERAASTKPPYIDQLMEPLSFAPGERPKFFTELENYTVAYDNKNSRIYLFRVEEESNKIGFVLNLANSACDTFLHDWIDSVNAYPDTYVVSYNGGDHKLLDITSTEINEEGDVFVLTRPIKIAPDVYKNIKTIAVRGNFERGKIHLALWGARDLNNWQYIVGKKHHIINYTGKPYLYYRVAVMGKLKPHESISHLSISYEPIHNNKIR